MGYLSVTKTPIRFQNYFHRHDESIRAGSRREANAPRRRLRYGFTSGKNLCLMSTDELEPLWRLQAILKRLSIRSICALPLRTAHRKLGAITFGSKQVDATRQRDRFVSQVADYIALAVRRRV